MELIEIQKKLHRLLKSHIPPLRVRKDTPEEFEVCGTIPAMQGRQKVDGFYFASVVPKPKDIRFYFFPIYTHPKQFEPLSQAMQKCLKGKSCFHFKKMDQAMVHELNNMVSLGVQLYQKDKLI
ncbi:hypothetical protein [Sediminicola sp. 1XM1-17]|uniref:hypothetical protein n=1 Tax=Sediminicola sp. 1XM1-17 TaxID=3127702 RepID=UPI003077C80F